MIQIIPSITIHGGKVKKLIKGDLSLEKVYEGDPVEVAKRFEDHGLEVVHLVDLDGSMAGSPVNYHVLEAIVDHTSMKVDFTGGLHTDGDINKAFEFGASYITAGSAAAQNKELFSSWMLSYGRERVTLAADVRESKVVVRGWQKRLDIDLFDHISYFYDHGLKYVKTTDVARDGELEGPAFELYDQIQRRFPNICILASGGVRSIDDIKKLQDMGVFAVIIGRALYEDTLTLGEVNSFLQHKTE